MKSRLAAVTLLALALAACDGHTEPQPADTKLPSVDEDVWKSDLAEEFGHEDFDFEGLQGLAVEDCKKTSRERWVQELARAGAGDKHLAEVTRINLRHGCPDVVGTYEEAWGSVHAVPVPLDELCSHPPYQLTLRDRLNAQGICPVRLP